MLRTRQALGRPVVPGTSPGFYLAHWKPTVSLGETGVERQRQRQAGKWGLRRQLRQGEADATRGNIQASLPQVVCGRQSGMCQVVEPAKEVELRGKGVLGDLLWRWLRDSRSVLVRATEG